MAGPFAFIPDGMKQVCNPQGIYSLQPVDSKNVDDLQKLLDGERAKVATLLADIEGMHADLKEKDQENQRLRAQVAGLSGGQPPAKKRAA